MHENASSITLSELLLQEQSAFSVHLATLPFWVGVVCAYAPRSITYAPMPRIEAEPTAASIPYSGVAGALAIRLYEHRDRPLSFVIQRDRNGPARLRFDRVPRLLRGNVDSIEVGSKGWNEPVYELFFEGNG